MSAATLVVALIGVLTFTALAGPWLLRQATPALTRIPRVTIALLIGTAFAWPLTAFALGPVLAWMTTGPALLTGSAAEVCQRCLDAATPFATTRVGTVVPVIFLLAAPALGAVFLGTALASENRRRRRATAKTGTRLRARAQSHTLLGYPVQVVDDPRPFALTLPRRHGGVFLSSAALDALTPGELSAVLAHERAHLDQHHHLLTTAVAGISRCLRWVPMMAAVVVAFQHYLEIAADASARRAAGTPALASALLVLGEHAQRTDVETEADMALHMVGPSRVRHLLEPGTGTAGVVPAFAAAVYLVGLLLLAATAYLPYLVTAITGCA